MTEKIDDSNQISFRGLITIDEPLQAMLDDDHSFPEGFLEKFIYSESDHTLYFVDEDHSYFTVAKRQILEDKILNFPLILAKLIDKVQNVEIQKGIKEQCEKDQKISELEDKIDQLENQIWNQDNSITKPMIDGYSDASKLPAGTSFERLLIMKLMKITKDDIHLLNFDD